ncbi:MAG: hypothetical protein JST67_09795 [Bacteroidetes bacterium]|nr:hypothetical protein [Bacteroidota bacterium]
MKKQIITALFAASCALSWAQGIKVRESNESFSNGNHNALSVNIYMADVSKVEKEWKSLMKDYGYQKSGDSKGEYYFDNVVFKQIGNNPVDVYSKATFQKADKLVMLTAAYDLGGAYLSSSAQSDKFDFLKKMMYDFSVKLSKAEIDEQIKDATKILQTHQNKQADLEKENKNLANDIDDYNKKIRKASDQIEQNKRAIDTKKNEVSAQQKAVDALNAKKDAVQ